MGRSKVLRSILRQYSSQIPAREFKEIQIKVPWGHVSGKWYGEMDTRPVVGFHGQRNNAGTFDTLAPLLPPHLGFLAIDLPGHGLSSWLPDGCSYHIMDYIILIHRLMDAFKWDKISMICHSMSGINGFTFASLYPEKCDLLIGLDVLKPILPSSDEIVNSLGQRLEAFNKLDQRNEIQKSTFYELDEIIQKLHDGSDGSIDKECCKYILKRSIKQSPQFPHKYSFVEDQRLKCLLFFYLPQHVLVNMVHTITCPFLCIKSKTSSYFEDKSNFVEILNVFKEKPNFAYHEVNGTHHFHLNDPKEAADIINPFIMKYRLT